MNTVVNRLRNYCENHGLRYSGKREKVAFLLEKAPEAVDAEQIWLRLKEDAVPVSIGAVYMALNWLVKAGFAHKHVREDRKAVFFLVE